MKSLDPTQLLNLGPVDKNKYSGSDAALYFNPLCSSSQDLDYNPDRQAILIFAPGLFTL